MVTAAATMTLILALGQKSHSTIVWYTEEHHPEPPMQLGAFWKSYEPLTQ